MFHPIGDIPSINPWDVGHNLRFVVAQPASRVSPVAYLRDTRLQRVRHQQQQAGLGR